MSLATELLADFYSIRCDSIIIKNPSFLLKLADQLIPTRAVYKEIHSFVFSLIKLSDYSLIIYYDRS